MQCPRCQQQNRPEADFCLKCGAPLTSTPESGRSWASYVELERALSEALEQQTATSEILRIISSSPTDVQPVFDAVAESAARLCDSLDAGIFLRDGDRMRLVANHGFIPIGPVGEFTVPLVRGTVIGRCVLEGRAVNVANVQTEVDEFPEGSENARRLGHRTILAVPLMREGVAIGAIDLRRTEARLFTERQVALLKTFADQAVIAIENTRLFADLTEALEQQTATAEILRVISSSPTELQPVLDAVVTSAARFCGASDALIFLLEGQSLRVAAHHGPIPALVGRLLPVERGFVGGRAVLERQAIHVTDLQAEVVEFPEGSAFARELGHRTTLGVPLLREGEAIGMIQLRRTEVNPFTDKQIDLLKTFADQAVIAIENVWLFTELEARNRDLTEALEQQTATSEILRIISSSPTDVQPVFDVIVESAVRLCGARFGRVYRYNGELIHMVASRGLSPLGLGEVQRVFPRGADDGTIVGRVILTRQPFYVRDIEQQEEGVPSLSRELILALGTRSQVTLPMLRAGEPIGAVTIGWAEPAAFDEQQIALLKTFADQAVIAIENVRLFTELEARNRDLTEALEQQTATSEILRIISSSPTDVQPTFAAIAASATQLCAGVNGMVIRFDGQLMHLAAHHNVAPGRLDALNRVFPLPPGRGSLTGRAIMTRAVAQVPDITNDPEYALPSQTTLGYRSAVAVPMLREGVPIGAILVARDQIAPFSENQIALLKTFADQAVIAIENVRLFTELQEKNRALTDAHAQVTEALEQQTATAEILRVISRSQTDVQPVFDTIVRSAVRLCDGLFSGLYQFDGELIHQGAHHNYTPEALEAVHRVFPARPSRALGTGRAILERAVVHIPDVEADPEYQHQELTRAIGFRGGLFVPMLREGAPIGVIVVARAEPGPFSHNEIELLKTFADQAVIAIENVRLFKELEARTAELTRSVQELKALGEVGQAVSSTLDLETVLTTIVARATALAGMDSGVIYEYEEEHEQFRLRATQDLEAEIVEALQATPVRTGEGVTGRMAVIREPVQIPDITQGGAYQSHVRDLLLRAGYRALLAVPLLREDHLLGGLVVNRKSAGEFAAGVVELLKTFATQSALAIQNARLFREIADKSRQLEAASRHKSEFLANMSHELRTPLNAIIGFSEVLLERMFGEVNEKQTEYLQDILSSGQHLLSLINDILDLSKIEAGRMELAPAPFHLPLALENALILVKERAVRHGISLHMDVDPRLGDLVGDERKIKQILLNLLSNAVKFTPEGGRISLKAVLTDGAVEISVSDTGIGIALEDQGAIFEEFRQVGGDETRKQEGTGLGLTLTRKFVEMHGGRIWVESEVGRGSTFTFTLPIRP